MGEVARLAACISAASIFLRDAPPFKDEYAGPILAIRVASVVWGCLCFLVLLGLTAFFIWRYIKTRNNLTAFESTLDQEYEYMFPVDKEGEESIPLNTRSTA